MLNFFFFVSVQYYSHSMMSVCFTVVTLHTYCVGMAPCAQLASVAALALFMSKIILGLVHSYSRPLLSSGPQLEQCS